jgi:hypothetical protein
MDTAIGDLLGLSDLERASKLQEYANAQFLAVQTALRLLKPGDVHCSLRLMWIDDPQIPNPVPQALSRPAAMAREYRFDEGDLEDLRLILDRLPSVEKHKKIEIALSRFNASYEKHEPEDQLIDAWVGLESLFGERDELKFRMAFRIARFLGRDAKQREWIFRFAKKTYVFAQT